MSADLQTKMTRVVGPVSRREACTVRGFLAAVLLSCLLFGASVQVYRVSQHGRLARALRDATEQDNLSTARSLLRAGADPNVPGPDGWTPLMIAVYRCLRNGRDPAMADLLLASGADPAWENAAGRSAIRIAEHGSGGGFDPHLLRRLRDHLR